MKMRATLLLIVGMAALVPICPCGAADVTQDLTAAAAGGCPQCTCSCSPWLGAWVGGFTEDGKDNAANAQDMCAKKMIETFKFSMINLSCDQFALNLQASLCEDKVYKAFPEANDMTEFVGVACKSEETKVVFTAVGYGMKKDGVCDEVVFIAIKSGTVVLPCSTGDPNAADVAETISIYAAEQDTNGDGLPDDCESVLCFSRTGLIKRVLNKPPQCKPSDSYVAMLKPCKDCQSEGTGKAFFKLVEDDAKLSFVVTAKNIKDATKVTIQSVAAAGDEKGEVCVVLCPIAPATECKSGDICGLVCCGVIADKDCTGPLQGKKIADLIKLIDEGKAVVVIATTKYPEGELCGPIEDP